MSRIGKLPVPVPSGVKVNISGNVIKITGSKGNLTFDKRSEIEVKHENNNLICKPVGESKKIYAFWGMTRTRLFNMVVGVEQGFSRKLVVEGIGYRAKVAGTKLTLSVGYSNPVDFPLPKGIKAEVDKNNVITISGIDKELVGLTSARIREIRKPEPYKGKGIRYEGEHIVRKVGKAASATT